MWTALTIAAAASLFVFWRTAIVVGIGCAVGAVVGGALAVVSVRLGNGFDFHVLGKGAVCGALVGTMLEVACLVFSSDEKPSSPL